MALIKEWSIETMECKRKSFKKGIPSGVRWMTIVVPSQPSLKSGANIIWIGSLKKETFERTTKVIKAFRDKTESKMSWKYIE